MKVALYARYSSDLQDKRSIDDQLASLRGVLGTRGWNEVAAFGDAGVSGAAIANRPGVLALLAAAEAGTFDIVFVEALDRLSRDQEGTAHIFKRLSYAGVLLETLSEGQISELHVGLAGTMNQLFLRELGNKTRRGLVARVKAGRSAGGRCFGYAVRSVGGLEINPEEAEVVRRIYRAYAEGVAPKAIVHALNREGIAAPRGGEWSPSALYGSRRALDGILCQELYHGVRVYNRRRGRKHPLNGKRSFVLNPPGEWLREPVPELRIVDEDLWQAVGRRRRALSGTPAAHCRRPKRLLSGLLRCSLCGTRMTLQGGRYACTANRDRGTCGNGKVISARRLEERVVHELDDGSLVADALGAAIAALHSPSQPDPVRSAGVTHRHPHYDVLRRRIERCKTMYVNGFIELDELTQRLTELQRQLTEARTERRPNVAALSGAEARRFILDNLHRVLDVSDGDPIRTELRRLIERVDFYPAEGLGRYTLVVVRPG